MLMDSLYGLCDLWLHLHTLCFETTDHTKTSEAVLYIRAPLWDTFVGPSKSMLVQVSHVIYAHAKKILETRSFLQNEEGY